MGRHQKLVSSSSGLDRRSSGYYSTPEFVTKYLLKCLHKLRPQHKKILDPCVGRGEMSVVFSAAGFEVTGVDVLDMTPRGVIEFIQRDFVDYVAENRLNLFSTNDIARPDLVIANPPYNCHETEYIRSNKARLSATFGKHSTLNMYSLFLEAILDFANEGAVIGIITFDSFLTARGHEPLRNKILNNFRIHRLHLCPTDLFQAQGADVRTCLMVLEKTKPKRNDIIRVSNRPTSTSEFSALLEGDVFEKIPQSSIALSSKKDRSEIVIGAPTIIQSMFTETRLGDLYPCITGISTGNDSRYLRPEPIGHFTVPFYKNPGSRRFYSTPDAYLTENYLEIAQKIPNFIVRNKAHLNKSGITCSSMGVAFGAALLPEHSTFGVNANIIVDAPDKWWLLGFLNSQVVTYLVRSVLLRSNMITAGYVSRIPLPKFDNDVLVKLGDAATRAYKRRQSSLENPAAYDEDIDELVFSALGISRNDQSYIRNFCANAVKLS